MKTWSAFLFTACLWAQMPDRPARPDEWGYRPADGSTVAVNPPAFSWPSDGLQYRFAVQWAAKADFSDATTVRDLDWSVYTHNRPLKPGTWYWRYQIVSPGGKTSPWSQTRRFIIPPDAVVFPQPTMAELAARIPKSHPRLFVTEKDLPRLREWAQSGGAKQWRRLLHQAEALLKAEPTPEPTVMGTISNPETRAYWWPNRMQTLKACQEGEVLAFAYLMTGDNRFRDAARRWALHLASWNPDGPTNWRLNDEAAMPILHRLARIYDWAYGALSPEDRQKVRSVLLRRAMDCWKGGQTGEGGGHLNRPYNSHGNRSWHKLAENAIATFGETPESERFLSFAVQKFFAAYPVWSDDDGGWHEGLAYWASYMVKATWWLDVARTALGIDGFKKPFFTHFADYALYSAPPGSPEMGFGDLSARPPSSSWTFVRYFTAGVRNPYWAWWADQWKISDEHEEAVMAFLWGAMPQVQAKAPTNLPASKLFAGIGVAILNSNLTSAAQNVQVRFKSSPFGRQSHGHDAHNSFTLTAYGEALLVNNVYRDYYGSPFHSQWCWSTKAQNALLVNGEGQKPHSADPFGRIVKFETKPDVDYVAGDATAAYEGKLAKYIRHIVFVKPDLVVIADELQAARPSTFQLMLHGGVPFHPDEERQTAGIERGNAGAQITFGGGRFTLKHWTGYTPEPDWNYLKDASKTRIPPQWHLEASTTDPSLQALLLTVIQPYRKGSDKVEAVQVEAAGGRVTVRTKDKSVTLQPASRSYMIRYSK